MIHRFLLSVGGYSFFTVAAKNSFFPPFSTANIVVLRSIRRSRIQFDVVSTKEIVEIVKSHGSNLSSIEKKRESLRSRSFVYFQIVTKIWRFSTRSSVEKMQSNLFFVPREERTGEIVQLVNRVNVGKSGGGFRSRGWENDGKLFLVRKNSCSKSPPAVAKPDRDITIPAKYYSIGTRNFLLYPGQVAESSESRVYFE